MATEHAVTTSGASSVNVPRDSCLAPMKSVKVLYHIVAYPNVLKYGTP